MPTADILRMLGIQYADIAGCQQAPTLKLRRKRLEQMKAVARVNYHRLALALHPDRTGDDDAKTALFREVAEAYNELMSVNLPAIGPGPAVSLCSGCTGVSFNIAA